MERLFRFLPLRTFISQINTLYTKLADYPGAAASRTVSLVFYQTYNKSTYVRFELLTAKMDHDYSTKQFGVCFTCEGQLRSDPCVETLVCEQCRRKGERGSVVGVGRSVLAYNPVSKALFLTSAAIVRRYDYCPVIWGSGMHIQYEWYRRATGPRRKIPAATNPEEMQVETKTEMQVETEMECDSDDEIVYE